jgi:hypothetical protein
LNWRSRRAVARDCLRVRFLSTSACAFVALKVYIGGRPRFLGANGTVDDIMMDILLTELKMTKRIPKKPRAFREISYIGFNGDREI